ncbi:MAG: c-type cytochrome [Verrucomicrobiaceae bacterium]|nr:c-type cytochrome [Verrucomicrobiaceae bacterium]
MATRTLVFTLLGTLSLHAADNLKSKTTYAKAYGETKNAVTVDPAKDLPRYPAVEPRDAIATWQVKKGFKLQLAAHEPQVRSPIAISYDEQGRMFACEMIDYSEMRDETPHLGRVSRLTDADNDGFFESSTVFIDDLPWPTGLICANGGVFVIATPDIWFAKDTDNDGKADVKEKVFTGFGTGLKMLNVQGLANSPQWGLDNRIHILAGGGNRGVITCSKRPELKGIELGGKDFWFDPRTFDYGLEGGGAQYGMSFDNYGRKFGCSNSDHLQHWFYDDQYTARNPWFQMPSARQSIAVDGGAAEVFRISPDEPWRIIRTRWRIAGVVKGAVEGGGRVSGYFTGATGTTIYRGDVYGPDFVNNSFSGDAGGQLCHRKIIRETKDGISLEGERPEDERGYEFAASKDTWVRVVNFANAPDGCLNLIDMYREVIEHPWSIPDEIKKHIDLNSGNNRGRIYRIVPENWKRPSDRSGNIAESSTEELVHLLSHPNGWHRDAAQRLLYERNDKTAIPALSSVLKGNRSLAKLHALGALKGLGAIKAEHIHGLLTDTSPQVREAAIRHAEALSLPAPALGDDPSPRVRFQLALSLSKLTNAEAVAINLAKHAANDARLADALASSKIELCEAIAPDATGELQLRLLTVIGAANRAESVATTIANLKPEPRLLAALATGLKKAGASLLKADSSGRLKKYFEEAATTAIDPNAPLPERQTAIQLLGLVNDRETLLKCIAKGQPDALQFAAVSQLGAIDTLVTHFPELGKTARSKATELLLGKDTTAQALLESGNLAPDELSASQVQSLIKHKNPQISKIAHTVLASVIPPSREEVVAKFKAALDLKGDASKGQMQFTQRCFACHKAKGVGMEVGPDLVTVKTRGKDGIMTAILEPHKEVAAQYIAYVINTKDGQTALGIIAEDNASSLTIKTMGGAVITHQRSNIKGTSSSGQSLMPEGLEQGMTPQDMADLLAFIESL